MLVEKKITEKILEITMTIGTQYPELSKYLNEMPVTLPDVSNPEIDKKILLEYYNSLDSMLKEYMPNHQQLKET